MGTQEEEREWVDVAKDLLVKCNISLRLRKVTDCDASIFVALYKAILGENVPDYIATPGSQEDDIHNVQSVIDSLALDYLQISLSHITGENVVRGDKDSIKNLLEIFDGLLEYLTEQISEEGSQNEEPSGAVLEDVPNNADPLASPPAEPRDNISERASRSSSEQSDVQSSKHSLHSCNVDETESTEIIRLGDSARTFTANQEVNDPFQPVDQSTSERPQTPNQKEPLNSAIPLRPPYQTTPHRPEQVATSHGRSPTDNGLSRGRTEEAAPIWIECRRQAADTEFTNGLRSNARHHSPSDFERSGTGIPKARSHEHREQEELPSAGPRRVLLRTQPDVLFLTLQDEMAGIAPLDEEEEEEEEEEEGEEEEEEQEDVSATFRQKNNQPHREKTRTSHGDVVPTDPLSWRRQKNKQAEQELHHMSEKLARRLEELDQMLQRALGESGEYGEIREEDKQSHHSDDRMDCQRTQKPTGTTQPPAAPGTHSQSPSPPRERSLVEEQLEGAMREASNGRARSQNNLTATRTHRREPRRSQRQHGQCFGEAYEEELRWYEERKQAELAKERLKAQDAEREYREALLKDAPRTPKASRARSSTSTTPQRSPQPGQVTPSRRIYRNNKRPAPMKVKDNDLLPKLLEEFPHLRISRHTLNRMWEQQLGQVEQIHTAQDPPRPRSSKLTSQVKEAQRRHDLLVEIIRKEQQHNKRLRDFKDRIQQQKSSQNRLREQRQQIARAKKYHQDYHVQLRARLMRARTKDERMFKKVFEEGLGIQKERLREQRAEAKEQRLAHQKLQQQEIQSMENYYKDQFSLLSETLALERQEIQVRKKAQEKALHKMKRDLRSKMEREIGELQQIIIQNDDEDYFRELEVERLRGRVQMASF